ncbi:hypothetical protein A4H97_33900 [Niastella yeongjuensis]|uniref:Uncharacterized protein n=1 Tax=Niastella yeongjuensis TaxID=354355 RepID=A0A1V9ECE1_9BACT|nr:hypothetical protein [Niastella yeongjuensis]OQP43595.1 hypothetical protein A4H97_33900 [Niastella yeongjuensis]SEP45881.1 hypothetical protein SAMN05660816_06373 [Niastella yeongjuensis]
MKTVILPLLLLALFCCKNPDPNLVQTKFERILEDTANNRRAKFDFEELAHYNNICKAIGLNRLYDGSDSLEIRVWRQFSVFGMAADEEIYSLKILDSTVSLSFYRVYCTKENYDKDNFGNQNPFTQPKIDSFLAISKTFSTKIVDSIDLLNLWNLKTLSALNISDSIGFLDGTTTSIELASKSKYKLIRYHVAYAYYEKTRLNDIKTYIDEYDKLIRLFQKNKIYALNY